MKNSKLIRVPPDGRCAEPGVPGDLGSLVTPALLAEDTHQTQLLFTLPACHCLALARPGQGTLRSPALDEQTEPSILSLVSLKG